MSSGHEARSGRRTGRRLVAAVAAAAMVGLPGATAAADEGFPLRAEVANVGDPTPDLLVRGRGWGHSAGMSQYGAYAMAREGRTHSQILQHYYRGVSLRTWTGAQRVNVTDVLGRPASTPVTARGGSLTWRIQPVGGEERQVVQPSGETWTLVSGGQADASRITLCTRNLGAPRDQRPGCATDDRAYQGNGSLEVRLSSRDDTQTQAGAYADYGNRQQAYGWLRHSAVSSGVDLRVELPLENYVRGIAEVPSGWGGANGGQAALEAQAITARGYALGRSVSGTPSVCATPACQVFAGYGKELEAGGNNWRAAVDATAGRYLVDGGGRVANTYYSSSHGGRSEAAVDSWAYGGAVPYLVSVDDPWSLDGRNPMRSWTSTVRNADLRRVTGSSGTVTRVEVRSRTEGGSPSVLRVTALDGSTRDFSTTPESQRTRSCNRRHAGNSLRCDLPVTGTRNAADQAFTGSGDRVPSSQIISIGFAPFTDDVGSLHEYATVWANRAGIAQGTDATTYSPRRAVTRAQMASFLDRTFDLPPASGQPFTDVDGGPHAASIAAVSAAGIAQGYDDGTFRPSQPVTREQMATFLTRAMGLTPRDPSFSDVRGVHARNVGALADSGITAGCDSQRFCPQDPVRRDQMATFLYRAARTLR